MGIVVDRESSPQVLPDVAFLVGFLANSSVVKDQLGEMGAVERFLDLMNRAYKQDGLFVSEVVANSCLALANVVILHNANIHRFECHKGVDLLVDALQERGQRNDMESVNGCSSLICNLCFKHEDMKRLMGKKRAPSALVSAMQNYSAVHDAAGSRCIASLFKAIGNLALNRENLDQFMEVEIERAYAKFLARADEDLDMTTMESAYRTLANLVLEKDNMERFECVVVPCLSLLRKERHCSTELHRWCFETIGNLCRWPENAKVFTLNDGVTTVMGLLSFLEDSPLLQASVIYVLGVQTVYPENIPILANSGFFPFVISVLRGFNSRQSAKLSEKESAVSPTESIILSTTLPISGLRCAIRLLQSKDIADLAMSEGILPVVFDSLPFTESQPMLFYATLRLVALLLYYHQDNSTKDIPNEVQADVEAVIAVISSRSSVVNTGRSSGALSPLLTTNHLNTPKHIQRLKPDRAWERVNIPSEQIDQVIFSIRRVLADERSYRHVRLQRLGIGILAYFAAEKIAFPALFCPMQMSTEHLTSGSSTARSRGLRESSGRRGLASIIHRSADPKRNPIYVCGEHRPSDPTSCVEIMQRLLSNVGHDQRTVFSCYSLLDNLVWASLGDLKMLHLLADKELLELMKKHTMETKNELIMDCMRSVRFYSRLLKSGGDIEDGAEVPNNSAKHKMKNRPKYATAETPEGDFAYRVLNVTDLIVMRRSAIDDYNIAVTGCAEDPYPDGVQSLPAEIKQKLRLGGSVITVENGKKWNLQWRSSHDLLVMEWKFVDIKKKELDNDPKYPFEIAISKILNVIRGYVSKEDKAASKKLGGVGDSSSVLTVIGPISATHPNGLQMSFQCKSFNDREKLLNYIVVWREASAHGFR